jgi:L-seryl-tRNA(Ser) seleniumtransferase
VDKLTLAALEASLAGPVPPVPAALARDVAELRRRAAAVVGRLPRELGAEVVDSAGAVGGGGAPEVVLPSVAIALPEGLAASLRTGEPPVVGRVERGRLLLDLLAVQPEEDGDLVDAVRRAAGDPVP